MKLVKICNIIAISLYHIILLIITFNNILLNFLIAVIYHFVSDGLFFQYIKSDSSIC